MIWLSLLLLQAVAAQVLDWDGGVNNNLGI